MNLKDPKTREKIGVIILVLILISTGILLIKDESKPITYKEPENLSAKKVSTAGEQTNSAAELNTKIVQKININKASIEELDTLPGIGEKTAQKIIDYRNTSGAFKVIEDIKEVSGIGEAKFNAIKDLISI